MKDPESAARSSLMRSLLIYGSLLAADIVVVTYLVTSGVQGAGYVTLSFAVIVGMLLGYQVYGHALDLRSPLAESEGIVRRKWKRAELIIAWDSYYVNVNRAVFRLQPEDFINIDEGMYVKVVHFPRTLNVVSIHEMRQPIDPDSRI